jgi:hypothetical protein
MIQAKETEVKDGIGLESVKKTNAENVECDNGVESDPRIEKAKEVLALLSGLTYRDASYVLGYATSSLGDAAILT